MKPANIIEQQFPSVNKPALARVFSEANKIECPECGEMISTKRCCTFDQNMSYEIGIYPKQVAKGGKDTVGGGAPGTDTDHGDGGDTGGGVDPIDPGDGAGGDDTGGGEPIEPGDGGGEPGAGDPSGDGGGGEPDPDPAG